MRKRKSMHGRAAKVSSRQGHGRTGTRTVLSTPYQNVVADIHRGRSRGSSKRSY